MAIDKIRPLKIESSALGGTEDNMTPTETDAAEDHLSCKGVALEGAETAVMWADSGTMKFKDAVITTTATLEDAINKLKLKTVDLSVLTNGYVLTWDNTNSKFYLSNPGSTTTGAVPPFVFSFAGGANTGTYYRTGSVPTSDTGQLVRGSNKIVEIFVSAKVNVSTTSTVQLQQRTGVSTTVDISGASVSLTSGNYFGSSGALNINIGPNWELACYTSLGSFSSPVVSVFIVPQ